jgi:glycolate oxidase iron-sulfur subunit
MVISIKDLVSGKQSFSGSDVPDDDLLAACVHCGMCLPTCPTYRLTGQEASSPRGRLWLMRAVSDGNLDLLDPEFDEQMYQCLNCRACEAVCPSGVHYGPLVEASRAQLEQHRKRPFWQVAVRKIALSMTFEDIRRIRVTVNALRLYQRSGLNRLVRRFGILKVLRLETLEAMLPVIAEAPLVSGKESWSAATTNSNANLFNGCVMSTVFSNVNRATGRVMAHNGIGCGVPEGQQCCGALHVHSGMMDEARKLARKNIEAFEKNGDAIVVTAAGCGAALKEYGFLLKDDPEYAARAEAFSNRVKDVTEFLAAQHLVKPTHHVDATVTYQEPCHLAHAQRITAQPRALLKSIPGLTIKEMKESSLCCGSAGIYNIIRREMADDLGDRKAEHIMETHADQVVTANPGCHMQLRTSLRRNNSDMPVRHIVELLDEAYGGKQTGKPGSWAIDQRATPPPA